MGFLPELLGFGRVRASATARAQALEAAKLEDLDGPDGVPTFVAGGRQTKGALPIETKLFEGAVYSSRGRGYARYNEDAAGVFKDSRGRLYGFVLDQAGGLGGNIRGEASCLAGKAIFSAFREIARLGPEDDPRERLRMAFKEAHTLLIDRKQGEVTTAVAVVVNPSEARLLNSGDSGAMHFSRGGGLKAETEPHEMTGAHAGYLKHALGLVPEGDNTTDYSWDLEPGDWLLLASDGLLDAELGPEIIGDILERAESAESAMNELCSLILRRMSLLRAKPDNLSVVLIRVKRASAG